MAAQRLESDVLNHLLESYKIDTCILNSDYRKTLLGRSIETQEKVIIKIRLLVSKAELLELEIPDLKSIELQQKKLQEKISSHIPRYLELIKVDKDNLQGFIIVQKYIPDSKSLEEFIQSGRRFSENEIKQLGQELLNILDSLHTQNIPIIHGNINPSSILIKNRSGNNIGEVYLTDFACFTRIYQNHNQIESWDYRHNSNSSHEHDSYLSPRSDLLSLGLSLCYGATGVKPTEFNNETFKDLSRGFVYWLHWMKESSPKRALTSAKEAGEALGKIATVSEFLDRSDRKLSKPKGSKVILNRNSNFLEIIVPATGFYSKATLIYSLPIISSSIAISYLFLHSDISSNYFLIFLWVCLSSFTSFMFLLIIYVSLFSSKRLYINDFQISLGYYLFGQKFSAYPESYSKDTAYIEYDHDNNQHFLKIGIGHYKYEFSSSIFSFFSLTKSEIYWIADELSIWLDS